MFPAAKFLVVVAVALWLLSVSDFHFEAYGDVIPSPTACVSPPCQQFSPPVSGYPSYGAPPPPSPPPSGYSIYGSPPPPKEAGQSKCPPAAGVQCCTPPAPYLYGYAPPNTYAPPNPYTYVPYGEGSASMLLPILLPLMLLFSSFIFLF
ncbi:putative extensin-3-like [Sesbania bispinosa]|nr:putative extensin-3-like [Sesbania bispinosa]